MWCILFSCTQIYVTTVLSCLHPTLPLPAESKLTGYYFWTSSLHWMMLFNWFLTPRKKDFIALNRIALHAWLQDSPENQVIMVFNSGIKENWRLKIWVGNVFRNQGYRRFTIILYRWKLYILSFSLWKICN